MTSQPPRSRQQCLSQRASPTPPLFARSCDVLPVAIAGVLSAVPSAAGRVAQSLHHRFFPPSVVGVAHPWLTLPRPAPISPPPLPTNKTLDYLRFCPKTRTVTCPRCSYVGDKDTNAAANLTLVFQFYLLYRKRPRFLDAPYASKYQRACDPSDWSTESGSSESAAPRRVNSGTGSSDSEPDTGDDTDDIDDTDDTDDTGDTDDGMDIDDIDAADDDDDNDDVNGNNSTAQAAQGFKHVTASICLRVTRSLSKRLSKLSDVPFSTCELQCSTIAQPHAHPVSTSAPHATSVHVQRVLRRHNCRVRPEHPRRRVPASTEQYQREAS